MLSALNCTQFEMLINRKPSLHHVRAFSCAALTYNSFTAAKLYLQTRPYINLGEYAHKVYLVELSTERRITCSANFTFDELNFSAGSLSKSSLVDLNPKNVGKLNGQITLTKFP